MGVWGLATRKICSRLRLLECQVRLFEQEIKVVIIIDPKVANIIDFCAKNEK